ncbi:MAG: 30S ribosomal protein S16 [Candidatus Omnitrophica bacterium]|nr:30S ribosomal protein S16 [Candidatus Omnitrophota bacterium]
MSLVIRLRKPGKSIKRRYHYKVVVDEKRTKKEGRFIEELGFWDPSKNPKLLKINLQRYKFWTEKGAKPTSTVERLVKKVKKMSSEKS